MTPRHCRVYHLMPDRTISIRGARTHNLKNVSVDIPQRQLTVVTGPSGSGKSSLAFNTLYAEGQRRFVESMSTYVRQFLERIDRPDVDQIDGILPAIAIEQKNSVKNARSTVATATELADHIRLFMTYCGETWCPDCGVIGAQGEPGVDHRADPRHARTASARSCSRRSSSTPSHRDVVVEQLVKAGFFRVWIDGEVRDLNELDTKGCTSFEMVINRLRIEGERRTQITEAIEQAFELSKGTVNVLEEIEGEWLAQPPLHVALRVQQVRHGVPRADAAHVLVQLAARRVHELPGLRPDHRHRHGEGDPEPRRCGSTSSRSRRGTRAGYEDCYDDLEKAAAKYRLRLDVPIKDLIRGRVGPALQRPRQVVRHQGLLRVAGDEEVQDPRPREAGEVPQLRALPAVPRLAAEERRRQREVPRPHHRPALRDGREDRAPLLGVPRDVEERGGDRRTSAPRDREPPRLSRRGGAVVSHARPPDAHALRRRVAAHQPRRGPRQLADGDDVRHRRADGRPARARQRAAAGRAAASEERREHGDRRRARSDDHRRRGLSRGAGAGRGGVRGRGAFTRAARRVARRPRAGSFAAPTARDDSAASIRIVNAREHNLRRRHRRHPARQARRGHRRLRLGQVDAHPQLPLQPLPARRPRRGRSRHRQGRRDRGDESDLRHGVRRSVADRPLVALESGDVHQGVGRGPQAARRDHRREAARRHRRGCSRSTPKAGAARSARARAS